MRLDVAFYILGIVCFALTVYIPLTDTINLITAAFIVVLILFGLLFVAFGYSTRPRKLQIIRQPPGPTETITPIKKEEAPQPPPSPPSTPSLAVAATPLTRIKGIGPKRLDQLKALQIVSMEDLAKWSAQDLAAKMGMSVKVTAKWVEEARRLLGESV